MANVNDHANPPVGPDLDLAQFTNMIGFANAAAAFEFLLTVKAGIKTAAMALTECATPEVRTVVHQLLTQGLDMHEQLSRLMMQKGWLHPYNLGAQFQLDLQSAQMTATIANLPLFKDRAKVLETFDTPQ